MNPIAILGLIALVTFILIGIFAFLTVKRLSKSKKQGKKSGLPMPPPFDND